MYDDTFYLIQIEVKTVCFSSQQCGRRISVDLCYQNVFNFAASPFHSILPAWLVDRKMYI